MPSLHVIDIGYAKHTAQLVGGNLHRSRAFSLARRGLGEGCRECGVKSHIAFNFLHGLVNVSVQNCYRAKLLEIRERLRAVVGPPSPLRIDRPERDMGKDNDWRAVLQVLDITFKPLELIVAEGTQTAGFEIHHVHKADEVNAILVEAVPALSFGVFCVTLAKHGALVIENVVFSWHKENLFISSFQNLVHVVEL